MKLDLDPAALARELELRLNAELPEGTRLEANGSTLTFYGTDGPYSFTDFDLNLDGRSETYDSLGFAVEQFLDHLQDDVAHATRGTIWPVADSESPTSPLPPPWVEVSAHRGDLRFGYGESGLTFDPIPLRTILR